MTDEERWMQMLAGFAEAVLEQMRSSAFVMLVLYDNDDATTAIQLGMAMVLDKPILVVCAEGARPSIKLRAIADEIVDIPIRDRSQWPEAKEHIKAAIERINGRIEKAKRWDGKQRKRNGRDQ